MGTLLLKFLSEVTRNRDVKRFHAKGLAQNKPMLAVFYNSEYKINTFFDGETYDIAMIWSTKTTLEGTIEQMHVCLYLQRRF